MSMSESGIPTKDVDVDSALKLPSRRESYASCPNVVNKIAMGSLTDPGLTHFFYTLLPF